MRGGGRDLRAWAALTFGLVHGFGFANVLREFGLPREALGWSLLLVQRRRRDRPARHRAGRSPRLLAAIRRRSDGLGARVAVAGSVVVIGAGTLYWFDAACCFPV